MPWPFPSLICPVLIGFPNHSLPYFDLNSVDASSNTLSEMEVPGVIEPNLSCKHGPLSKPTGHWTKYKLDWIPIICIYILPPLKPLF